MVPYAGPIHFGWPARNIEAQPFLWEAADDESDRVVSVYEDEVSKIVRKIDLMTPDR